MAYRVLSRILTMLSMKQQAIVQTQTSDKEQEDNLLNPFIASSDEHQPSAILSIGKSYVMSPLQFSALSQCSHFELIMMAFNCFFTLGKLYILRGSVQDGEYFYAQALDLTEAVGAHVLARDITQELARLAYLCHDDEQSRQRFEHLLKEYYAQDEAVDSIALGQRARTLIYHSEYEHYRGQTADAIIHLEHAQQVLTPESCDRFIQILEQQSER
jgi:hypothetical protein